MAHLISHQYRRVRLGTADEIAGELVGAILKDLSMARGHGVLLLVNAALRWGV